MRFTTSRFASLVGLLALALSFGVAPPTRADTFTVIGVVEDGYAGPAEGVQVTLCEYDTSATGFSATVPVPETGIVNVVFPLLPAAVAFEVEADPVFEDVHIVVAQPVCPVSPCNPTQTGIFAVRLERRPKVPIPAESFRPLAR